MKPDYLFFDLSSLVEGMLMPDRVTRLGEFLPVGDCLLWAVFL
jgi:hypothetical protein